jgi:hypothetical protein
VQPVVRARIPWSGFLGSIALIAGLALVAEIVNSTNSTPPIIGAMAIASIYVMAMPMPEGVGLDSTQPRPMMELRRSHRVGLQMGLVAAAVHAVVIPFTLQVTRHPWWAFFGTLSIIFQVFVVVWYRQGGAAILQYIAYGRLLRKRNAGCTRYDRFLEHASDTLLLRRVGMGYQFIHHYVLEYFADQWSKESRDSQRIVNATKTGL